MKMFKRISILLSVALALASCTTVSNQSNGVELIPSEKFITKFEGKQVALYTIANSSGMTAQITNFGARVVALWVKSNDGSFKDVVWGYPSIQAYLASTDLYAGPIVGRFGNRIDKGRFAIEGKEYQLTTNEGQNQLHGGKGGFSEQVWNLTNSSDSTITLNYVAADGEEGYPAQLSIDVIYTITADNALKIDYRATTDGVTILNPTSHCYFNLYGTSAESTNSHILYLNADNFTPTNSELIPTGQIESVIGTPLDFSTPTLIGDRIEADCQAIKFGGGYDHNFVINRSESKPYGNDVILAATLYEPKTGIEMSVLTDQPAVQFYSGNFMDGKDVGKRGDVHNYRTGVALEAQNFPAAPNHPNFPSPILRQGEQYTQTTIYAFSVK